MTGCLCANIIDPVPINMYCSNCFHGCHSVLSSLIPGITDRDLTPYSPQGWEEKVPIPSIWIWLLSGAGNEQEGFSTSCHPHHPRPLPLPAPAPPSQPVTNSPHTPCPSNLASHPLLYCHNTNTTFIVALKEVKVIFFGWN